MTVAVPQDNKRKVQSNESNPMPKGHVEPGGLRITRNRMRACSHQNKCQVRDNYASLWRGGSIHCITNDPYVLSIVAKEYRLCYTIPPFLLKAAWEIKPPQKIQGMQEQISLMLQKNEITRYLILQDSIRTYSWYAKHLEGGIQ